MKKVNSVEEYIESHVQWTEALIRLRRLLNSTELAETIKWSAPIYTINNKNVLGLGAFKNHFCIWFFNGVFLTDEKQLLVNAQEDKTKALRQMRFTSIDDINDAIVLAYINEAIENQKLGKEITPDRSKKTIVIPKEINEVFDKNPNLKLAFTALSPYKQREYADYISSAKRDTTKQTRLEKIMPMILQGVGLHDKYKNC